MENNNKGTVIGFALLSIVLLVLCILFATETISFTKKVDNSNKENNNITNNNEVVNITDSCKDYEETFNGITVKVNNEKSEGKSCWTETLNINDEEYYNGFQENTAWITKFAIYDKYVISYVSHTGGSELNIYNTETKSFVKDEELTHDKKLNEYNVRDFAINDDNIIIIANHCGAQCGYKDTVYQTAIFAMDYKNGEFSEPKLLEKLQYKLTYYTLED